jgi:hypothetical protein
LHPLALPLCGQRRDAPGPRIAKLGAYAATLTFCAKPVEEAHSNAAVQALWERFAEVCDYELLANLPECQRPFSPFEPVEV